MNGNAHQQGPIVSHEGWQYTAFYTESGEINGAGAPIRNVSLGRRALPDGEWEVMTLRDYAQTKNDPHNVVAIGLSASDGRIHLAFDMHAEPLHYRQSLPGVLEDPAATAWTPELFGPVQDFLEEPGAPVDVVTYPRFVMKPSGGLLLELRKGGSGSGDSLLWDYENGAWEARGVFVSGTSSDTTRPNENAYYNGIQYDGNGRLHATWTWRETPDPVTNHDLMYLYSDDDGRTWHRNDGERAAVTGVDPVRPDTPGVTVWEIPQGSDVGNQEGQWVDQEGRVHVTMRDDDSGVREHVHYFRDLEGTWHQNRTGIAHTGRSKIVTDKMGNAFILTAGLQVLAATSEADYADWRVAREPVAGLGPEPLFDPVLAADQGLLSVFIPEVLPGGFAPSTGVIHVKDFAFSYPVSSLQVSVSGEPAIDASIIVSVRALDEYGNEVGAIDDDDVLITSSDASDVISQREVRLGQAGERRLTVALDGVDVTGYVDLTVPADAGEPEPTSTPTVEPTSTPTVDASAEPAPTSTANPSSATATGDLAATGGSSPAPFAIGAAILALLGAVAVVIARARNRAGTR
ncbi:BNR-4 repeat-containing protein [Microbacterium xanthum]|uniref:BNR-4 repeat-containing protein n=1 Tax=Microbacterium xanthum TaxID=3079794 RepID=UPI002AD370DC|nr:BNR-4 repeat-containing protein [Microbacterium sp. KSW-48]MDZ8171153.1 BNR-4 repeat-containing protein [Microbacterium sp. KSW-48]